MAMSSTVRKDQQFLRVWKNPPPVVTKYVHFIERVTANANWRRKIADKRCPYMLKLLFGKPCRFNAGAAGEVPCGAERGDRDLCGAYDKDKGGQRDECREHGMKRGCFFSRRRFEL